MNQYIDEGTIRLLEIYHSFIGRHTLHGHTANQKESKRQ